VTDLSHDAGEDAFHEIQLSGKQLVFLFMVTTVISVVIFLCGVLVGRGVHAEPVNAAAAATSGQAEPIAAAGPGAPDRTPPSATPPTPPAEGQPVLSYPNTLQSAKPPTEDLRASAAEAKKTAEAATPEVRTPPPASVPAASTQAPAAPAQAPAAAAAASTGASRSGVWAVQVVALTDRAAANAVVQRLSAKGYPAFLVNPQAGAPVQNYKVQVGRFADRTEAEQVKTRLKKEEQFEPWILR
jgi:cell division septation protein DedD